MCVKRLKHNPGLEEASFLRRKYPDKWYVRVNVGVWTHSLTQQLQRYKLRIFLQPGKYLNFSTKVRQGYSEA